MSNNVMVVREFNQDGLSDTTAELLTGASSLSAGGTVSVILLGAGSQEKAESSFSILGKKNSIKNGIFFILSLAFTIKRLLWEKMSSLMAVNSTHFKRCILSGIW